jgi:hypothetical protein
MKESAVSGLRRTLRLKESALFLVTYLKRA